MILSESQDNRTKAFSDRWMSAVQEWEKVTMGETQRLIQRLGGGGECVISQGAKPCSRAKARPRQAERGCLCLSWGIQGLKMKQWRGAPTEAESDG